MSGGFKRVPIGRERTPGLWYTWGARLDVPEFFQKAESTELIRCSLDVPIVWRVSMWVIATGGSVNFDVISGLGSMQQSTPAKPVAGGAELSVEVPARELIVGFRVPVPFNVAMRICAVAAPLNWPAPLLPNKWAGNPGNRIPPGGDS